MSDPTIQIPSCRGDERCPVCHHLAIDDLRRLACGCCTHAYCAGQHQALLLTEAIQQRDAIQQGISSEVAMLREDVARLRATAALRVEERDDAIRDLASARGVINDLRESLDRQEEEIAALTRERDEQRHPCPCGKDTASIRWARCYSCRQQESERAERAEEERDAAIRERDQERRERTVLVIQWQGAAAKAVERAERAEALLRECAEYAAKYGSTWRSTYRFRDALLAKIREHLGAPNER